MAGLGAVRKGVLEVAVNVSLFGLLSPSRRIGEGYRAGLRRRRNEFNGALRFWGTTCGRSVAG